MFHVEHHSAKFDLKWITLLQTREVKKRQKLSQHIDIKTKKILFEKRNADIEFPVPLGISIDHKYYAIEYGTFEGLRPYFSGDISAMTISEVLNQKKEFLNMPVTIGASGSVFGLLLAFGWLFPEERLFLMFIPVPIKARWFVLGYAVVELFLGVAQFSGDSIAHFAHLGGMLFGALLILYWKRKGKLYR